MPSSPVTRRRCVLATIASLIPTTVAGCTGHGITALGGSAAVGRAATARLTMSTLADAKLPEKVLYSVAPDDTSTSRIHLLERIVDGGTPVQGTRPPLPADQHLLFEDTVYQLSETVTERTAATLYSVKVDISKGFENDSTAIAFADLPKVDRQKFADHGLADGKTIGIGTMFLYTDAERAESVLVPDSQYSTIVWDSGARAEWVVDDASETTLNTYRYTADQVATAAEYGRQMRDRFTFALSDLSEAQQQILKEAVSKNGYLVGADGSPPTAFTSLAEQFRAHEQAHALDQKGEGDLNGPYLVTYDDEVYWTVFILYGKDGEPRPHPV